MLTPFILTQLILETPKYVEPVKPVVVVAAPKTPEPPPQPIPVPEPPPEVEEPVAPPVVSDNEYPYLQCTWYLKERRPDLPNHLSDARYWFDELADMGWAVGYVPRAGAIGQSVTGNHVVYIEYVNPDGSVHLSERNYDYQGSYRERDAPATSFKYIY